MCVADLDTIHTLYTVTVLSTGLQADDTYVRSWSRGCTELSLGLGR